MSEIENVIGGGFNLLDWYRSGRPAVEPETSTARAARCVACPLNGEGPLTQWFTEPTSERIKQEIEKRAQYHLQTAYDAALGVCEACHCPLKTKVHEPIDLVIKHMARHQREKLWDRCWILHEENITPTEQTTHEQGQHSKSSRLRGLINWYRRKRGVPDNSNPS